MYRLNSMRLKISLLGLMALITIGGCAGRGAKSPSRYDPSSSYTGRDGTAEAKKDIAQGSPKLKAYGLPMPSAEYYAMLLNSKLGIYQETIAGCVVSEDLVKYAHAYNAVVEKYAKKKFGDNIFDQIMTEAEQLYLKHPNMDEKYEKWADQHEPPIH